MFEGRRGSQLRHPPIDAVDDSGKAVGHAGCEWMREHTAPNGHQTSSVTALSLVLARRCAFTRIVSASLVQAKVSQRSFQASMTRPVELTSSPAQA
jgi:hypothetical protein